MAHARATRTLAGWQPLIAAFFAVCVFCAGHVAASSADRMAMDEEVLGNLRTSLLAWRNHINKGDVSASPFYMPGAALYAELGPAANFLYFDEKMKNPITVRGVEAISQFWNQLVKQVGLRKLRVFEEEGPFAFSHLVVNDNEVIVSGPFEFDSIKGHFSSMTWVRPAETERTGEDTWKMQSQMMTIEVIQDLKELEHRASNTTDLEANLADKLEEKLKDKLEDKHYPGYDPTGAFVGGLDAAPPVAPDALVRAAKPGTTGFFGNVFWSLVGISMIVCAIYLWKKNRNRRNLSPALSSGDMMPLG